MGVNLVVGAVGTALNTGLNMAVAGKQAAIAQENANEQANLRTQAMGNVNNAVDAVTGMPTTASNATMTSAGDYAKALAGTSVSGAPAVAGANARYAKENAVGGADVGSYSGALTKSLSTITGVQQAQRLAQQAEMNAATNVSALQSESYADTLVNQMRQAAIKANPILAGVAQGMMAVGGMSSLSGLGTGSKIGGGSAYSTADPNNQGFTEAGTPIAAGGTDLGSAFGGDESPLMSDVEGEGAVA